MDGLNKNVLNTDLGPFLSPQDSVSFVHTNRYFNENTEQLILKEKAGALPKYWEDDPHSIGK